MDGSGYMMLLNQENESDLETYQALITSINYSYITRNTKAVLVNFNLNYSPTNLNITASMIFEYSPIGNLVAHRSQIDLFVLQGSDQRTY